MSAARVVRRNLERLMASGEWLLRRGPPLLGRRLHRMTEPTDVLVLADEPDSPVNPRAMLVCTRTGRTIACVPNYLLGTIHELREFSESDVGLVAEHVNPPTAPSHMRLLCRLRAPWPDATSHSRRRSSNPSQPDGFPESPISRLGHCRRCIGRLAEDALGHCGRCIGGLVGSPAPTNGHRGDCDARYGDPPWRACRVGARRLRAVEWWGELGSP